MVPNRVAVAVGRAKEAAVASARVGRRADARNHALLTRRLRLPQVQRRRLPHRAPASWCFPAQLSTPPLVWQGAPEGTKGFALVMDHIDRDGVLKVYWTLFDIPASTTTLPTNVRGVGRNGATWKRDQTYVPPHSAGGAKQTYTIHLYALDAAPQLDSSAGPVTRDRLLAAIRGHVLDSADLRATYQRPRDEAGGERKGKR
jgi:phosphatidylethanolamine-binding protein (PEBP) family uncharacterized protein